MPTSSAAEQPQSRRVEAVLFDYSGVMTATLGFPEGELPFDGDALLAEMLPALSNQGDHLWHGLERGEVPLSDFIAHMESKVPGSTALFAADSAMNAMANLSLLDDRVAIVRSLAARGVDVALVTNNVAEWEPLWKSKLPDGLFPVVIDSSMVGSRKPEPGIYQAALDAIGVPATAALFIDDFEWNLVGAAELGMRTVHCTADIDLGAAIDLHLE